ncbi:SLC13 family permease [Balneolaceae bacterium ANBcel3]|nr:SLC13 family permease [Balneolaceae bacterium ANBcel3]
MKADFLGLTFAQLSGLLLGIFGLVLPFLLPLGTLSFAGQLGLGILLLAAAFWIFEPIPIFATSMLVIFLQVFLLSAQSPVFSEAELPVTEPVDMSHSSWQIPASALKDDQTILVSVGPGETKSIHVSITERNGQHAIVKSDELRADHPVITQPNHRLVNYDPSSYTAFTGTLAHGIIILFLGGFMLAGASVKYNLDKNLTRYLLAPFGSKPRFILLGIILVTAVLSAFMSNTATAAMMVTVIIPIIAQLDPKDQFKYGLALAIPIAANIGGIATPIGTPPNAIAIGALQGQGIDITFTEWMIVAVPIVLIMLFISWVLLQFFFPPKIDRFKLQLDGKLNLEPKAIGLYIIFAATVILWITEEFHGIPSNMIAFIPVATLVAGGILTKEDVKKIPWDVLWLMAGGLSLGVSMQATGLAAWLIGGVDWASLGYVALILSFALVAVAMSNFLSNTVTATLIMPLVIGLYLSGTMGDNFSLIIVGVVIAVSCSLAMALPISTPPNAIAMSTGFIRTKDMAKVGLTVGFIGIIMILIMSIAYWPFVTP